MHVLAGSMCVALMLFCRLGLGLGGPQPCSLQVSHDRLRVELVRVELDRNAPGPEVHRGVENTRLAHQGGFEEASVPLMTNSSHSEVDVPELRGELSPRGADHLLDLGRGGPGSVEMNTEAGRARCVHMRVEHPSVSPEHRQEAMLTWVGLLRVGREDERQIELQLVHVDASVFFSCSSLRYTKA
ncbi:MAG: hypothetical protein R3A51_21335 [Nannocystaceae bacterium]